MATLNDIGNSMDLLGESNEAHIKNAGCYVNVLLYSIEDAQGSCFQKFSHSGRSESSSGEESFTSRIFLTPSAPFALSDSTAPMTSISSSSDAAASAAAFFAASAAASASSAALAAAAAASAATLASSSSFSLA